MFLEGSDEPDLKKFFGVKKFFLAQTIIVNTGYSEHSKINFLVKIWSNVTLYLVSFAILNIFQL